MKVYVVVECDFQTGNSVVKSVFSTKEKAMDLARLSANERIKRYSQTRVVEELDDRFIVKYEEEGVNKELINGDCDIIAIYYVAEKLVIN